MFIGFGVFLANASVKQSSFRLSEGELAHALALFCLLRDVPRAVERATVKGFACPVAFLRLTPAESAA